VNDQVGGVFSIRSFAVLAIFAAAAIIFAATRLGRNLVAIGSDRKAAVIAGVTPDLLKEAGYNYIMDWPADDQPFWMRTRAGPLLSVPYRIEFNDSPTMLSRAQSSTDFRQMIVDHFETMLKLSAEQSLVFGISLHTFVAGQPFRLTQIRQALQYLLRQDGIDRVWISTPGEVAQYSANLPKGVVPGCE
jgi:allantoinase